MRIQRVLFGLSMLSATALFGCGPAEPEDEFVEAEGNLSGTFQMKAVHSAKCLDVQGASTADGAIIHQWGCHSGANQRFKFVDVGNGNHQIIATNSNKCLDVRDWSTADGGRIQQWGCSGNTNQLWKLEVSNGQYRIRSVYSNKCLDIAGVSQAEGAPLQQWSCSSGGNQRFTLGSGSTSGGGSTGGTTACPAWRAGTQYKTGDKVTYNGGTYIAEHDNPGYDPTISTWFWDPAPAGCGSSGGGSTGGGSTGGGSTGGTGVGALLSSGQFNNMFPNRNGFYTYDGLIQATSSYPAFGGTGDTTTRKREIAAFLANANHETGGLVYVEEIAKGEYCQSSGSCPCEPGKRYFGRGPIQLSWNYNYCAAGSALGLNLRADPDLVARSSKVAWQTGLWFWMTSTGAGSMTAHNAMVNNAGFGQTIRTINGALECNGGNPGQVNSRIDAYRRFCSILGVDPGGNLGC